ncbi:FecR domain-containing protein [Niabella drilacis]|uniref:FecR family protein n=1 Tax=Niabella drilacis (strain DSM 25811 / CCM 8410 / CCUG 62505 / LMG 26954 / E90) TaxID=1285928 RepID=A0A1G6V6S1_NIADE|nr:FecR domain-containing protein [Niabella drilacis]SDD49268.1 FecR family protein [Niabella drilacis]
MEHKLVAYHEQLLDASEQKEVEQWLLEDPAHEAIYEKTIRTWEASRMSGSYTLYNKERAWEQVQAQIDNTASAPPRRPARIMRMKWWQAGAIAASFAGLVVLFFMMNRPGPREYTAQAAARNIRLKDKSSIVLYPNARLEIDKNFNEKDRVVVLKGDAQFDIARDPGRPFIIHNQDMDVQVLGTSFTIQQRADFNTVFVRSGKVKATVGGQMVTAVAHQKIVKDNHTGQLQLRDMKTVIDEVLETQTIRCRDMRIDQLVRILEELYNIEIVLDPALAGRKITSTYFSYEAPEQAIENIALTMNATWQKKENHYVITK